MYNIEVTYVDGKKEEWRKCKIKYQEYGLTVVFGSSKTLYILPWYNIKKVRMEVVE